MSRLQQNLKIIVGIKSLEDKIKLLESKSDIDSKRFIILQKGPLDPNAVADGALNGINGRNGSPTITPTNDTKKTAAQVIDDNLPLGSKLDYLDGLYDCDSGKQIIVGETGSYIPPPGWENGNTPPGQIFILGQHWGGFAGTFYATANAAFHSLFVGNYGGGTNDQPLGSGNYYEVVSDVGFFTSLNGYAGSIRQIKSNNVVLTPPGDPFYVVVTHESCTLGSDDSCPTSEPPSESQWPTKDEFQLARIGGKLVPNALDPNVPAKYKDGNQSTLDFCFGDGRHGRQEETVSAGFMIYETDEDGSPISDAKMFSNDGYYQGRIDKTKISEQRPNN